MRAWEYWRPSPTVLWNSHVLVPTTHVLIMIVIILILQQAPRYRPSRACSLIATKTPRIITVLTVGASLMGLGCLIVISKNVPMDVMVVVAAAAPSMVFTSPDGHHSESPIEFRSQCRSKFSSQCPIEFLASVVASVVLRVVAAEVVASGVTVMRNVEQESLVQDSSYR